MSTLEIDVGDIRPVAVVFTSEELVVTLADGRRIESVFIPDTPSMTFCVSTQVGCAMACGFCLTGKMGLVRNLTAGEIAGQVRVLAAATGLLEQPFNIVLMGMGEPLHNVEATLVMLPASLVRRRALKSCSCLTMY